MTSHRSYLFYTENAFPNSDRINCLGDPEKRGYYDRSRQRPSKKCKKSFLVVETSEKVKKSFNDHGCTGTLIWMAECLICLKFYTSM